MGFWGFGATKVDKAEVIDDQLIVVRGTTTSSIMPTTQTMYTHVLKGQDKKWQIIAAQRAYPSVQ